MADRRCSPRRARLRRGQVVAQVLSYAGYLQGLDPAQLESRILATHLPSGGTVVAAVEADDQQHALDQRAFQEELARTLAEGSFQLVIGLDSVPDELVQVVGYLELVTDKIGIDLVTVTAYDVAGSRVLVPQRVDPGRRLPPIVQVTALDPAVPGGPR